MGCVVPKPINGSTTSQQPHNHLRVSHTSDIKIGLSHTRWLQFQLVVRSQQVRQLVVWSNKHTDLFINDLQVSFPGSSSLGTFTTAKQVQERRSDCVHFQTGCFLLTEADTTSCRCLPPNLEELVFISLVTGNLSQRVWPGLPDSHSYNGYRYPLL